MSEIVFSQITDGQFLVNARSVLVELQDTPESPYQVFWRVQIREGEIEGWGGFRSAIVSACTAKQARDFVCEFTGEAFWSFPRFVSVLPISPSPSRVIATGHGTQSLG